MRIGVTTVMTCLTAALALSVAGPAAFAEQKPSKKALEGHKTKPGGKYQPRMDVMPGEKTERPGQKPGLPKLTDAEFKNASRIYFERCAG